MRQVAMLILAALAVVMVISAFKERPVVQVASTQEIGVPTAQEIHTQEPPANPSFDSLYIFILAGFVGFEVIGRVSPTLHTPLMSATNAISAISVVGAILAAGSGYGPVSTFLGFMAVTAATINVVGGFMITDRMLKMFKRKDSGNTGSGSMDRERILKLLKQGSDISVVSVSRARDQLQKLLKREGKVDE